MSAGVKRLTLAAVLFLCACNTAPKNTCTPYVNSLAAAGTPPASCNGPCTAVSTGADASFQICTIDCTAGGQAECTTGTACFSAAPIGIKKSYCLLVCGTDDAGNDAGSCPSPLACYEAGVCLPTCSDGGICISCDAGVCP